MMNDFGALSKAVQYCKFDERGVSEVCEAVKSYGDKRAAAAKAEGKAEGRAEGKIEEKIEVIKGMLSDGIPFEKALKIAKITEKQYYEYLKMFDK